ncbi:Transposon Ty3-G Gag-Pol polyprotein [Sesamum angolense]|uniref:RNA-directed DNA polymerase n=1 Tax=Sesamum angolense TaxID=2727404 RepID=A0AAE2C3U4_9LAMI|nr:Transposon Ty3-G Gag-Pol polyprotein [Sesamum angolense]
MYCLLTEDEALDGTDDEDPPMDLNEENMEISINALNGNTDFNTFRVKGKAYGHELQILIDGGNTHCFLDEMMANRLGCELEQTTPMVVSVADGRQMVSQCVLSKFLMGDPSPVEYDYNAMTITVSKNGKKWGLQALKQRSELHLITTKGMTKLMKEGAYGFVEQLHLIAVVPVTRTSLLTQDTSLSTQLTAYSDIFEEPQGLPPQRTIQHQIVLKPDAVLKKMHPYRYSYSQKNEIETIVKSMLKQGIIQPNQSPFGSPILLVKKKDGTWRMCIDYRYLNSLTVKYNFPIPIIDELLDELHGACYFSKIDLRSGYFQIRMSKDDVQKTSFVTHQGHYEFLVMPFSLCNAPSTFQSLANNVFAPYLRKFILVFFDDILVYSKTWSDHLAQLQITLELVRQHQLFAKQSKCDFGKESVEYLGHIISKDGVSTDPSKVECMKEWPLPRSVKELRGFLGLTGYYPKFIKSYGILSKPLSELLRKDSFKWTYACDKGIGTVLMQEQRPIAYLSKGLSTRNQGLSMYEKEFLAILHAVHKWKHYLCGHHFFVIKTDHQSLKHILEQKVDTALQQKWISKLLGLDYEKSYEHDAEFLPIIQAKIVQGATQPSFTLQGGVLRNDNKICVGQGSKLRDKIIGTLHDSAIGGHSGIQGTYQRLKAMFYWPKLKEDVTKWLQACDICQRSKAEHMLYPGLLLPLPIPNQAWASISMDFIEGLPKSEGKDCILVIVDCLTKYSHFLSLTHPFTAEGVAKVFMDHIHKLHGLPISIVTDRDKVFTSSFWKEFFKLLGTTLSFSTTYHPQTDGQTERLNQCIDNYMRCMCHLRPKQWNQWLSLAEYWYNTNFHTSLKLTPFQALYGYPPGPLTIDPYIPSIQLEVDEYLTERGKLIELLKHNLKEAQNRMNVYADKHRTEEVLRVYPAKLLARRLISRRNMAVPQVLVQWENYSESDATWEDYYDIICKFPDVDIDPQGRGSNLPGGNVMSGWRMKTESQQFVSD